MIQVLTKDNLKTCVQFLTEKDKDLKILYEKDGNPPLWDREPGFTTLVRIILEQQVSLLSARAVFLRLQSLVDPFESSTFASLGEQWFRERGVTRQKARYLVNLAGEIEGGGLELDRLQGLTDEHALEILTAITGIGPWTAQIYLIMALGRPDVWPRGDIALLKSLCHVKGLDYPITNEAAGAVATQWRPYRSVAARMLWQNYLIRKGAQL